MTIGQTSISLRPVKALLGMLSDGARNVDILSRKASAAVDAGRLVFGDQRLCGVAPDSDDDVLTFLGMSLYQGIKEPETSAARYAADDMVSILHVGRGWASLKAGTPVSGRPVYCYVGATTADRGMVGVDAETDYVKVPGCYFTGNVETTGDDVAEIELQGFGGAEGPQIVTGVLAAGTCTLSNIVVTASTRIIPVSSTVVTGSTNVGELMHLKASDVVGGVGVGSAVIQMLGDDGAVDADAAGTFVAFVFN